MVEQDVQDEHHEQHEQHEPEDQPERTIWTGHPAMFRNHPFWFLLLAVLGLGCMAAAVMFWQREQPVWAWIFVAALGCVGVMYFVWWLRCIGVRLTVTTQRTRLRRGILSKHTREVRHSDVRSIDVQQSFWERVFNVGQLQISSAGRGTVEIEVKGLGRPSEIREMIDTCRPM